MPHSSMLRRSWASSLENYAIDIVLDQGPNARSVRLDLPRFTLVGATTRIGLIAAPLRERFGLVNRLSYYEPDQLAEIVKRSAAKLGVDIDDAGALEIARRSRGTPRIANNLLRRVRDYAQVKAGRSSIRRGRTASTSTSARPWAAAFRSSASFAKALREAPR